jgi:YggT family protein
VTFVHHPLYALGCLYLIVLVLRAVLSWFPVEPGSGLSKLNHWLYVLTEPVVAPLRKVIPPAGMLDVSFFIVFVLIYLLTQFVLYRVTV